MKRRRILSLIAAVLMLVTVLASCMPGEKAPEDTSVKPVETAQEPTETTAEPDVTTEPAVEDDLPAVRTLYEALKEKGSVEIGLSSLPAGLVDDSVDVGNIKAKIYYAENKSALELGAQISGKTYDLIATISEKEITLRTGLLDGAYGINLDDAKKNIGENEFLSDLLGKVFGSDDGENKPSVDIIIDSLKNSFNSAKQLRIFAGKYGEKLKDIVNKVCEINKSSENGGSVINFTVRVEDAAEILKQLYGEFRNDAELRDFIEANFGEAARQAGIPIDDLYSLTDEQIRSFADEYTEQFKGYRLEGEIRVSGGNNVLSASFVVKDPSEKDFARIEISLEGDVKTASLEYEGGCYSVSYEIKTDTEQEYNAVVNLTRKENNATVTIELCNISYNKETNAYTAVIYANDAVIKIKGTLEVSPSYARFTVSSVTIDEEEVFSGEFYVILNANDSMPEPAEGYTDILTLSEEDFNDLAEKIMAQMPSFEPEGGSADV